MKNGIERRPNGPVIIATKRPGSVRQYQAFRRTDEGELCKSPNGPHDHLWAARQDADHSGVFEL